MWWIIWGETYRYRQSVVRAGRQVLIFVSSLMMVSQDFDYVIKRYCRDGPGNFLVGQGDYQIIRANNSKKIDPSEFVNAVEPEMTLEMSIILRQRTPGQNNKETCPQCKYINSTPTQTHGWVEWQVPISLFTYVMINVISHSRGCFGQFQSLGFGWEQSRKLRDGARNNIICLFPRGGVIIDIILLSQTSTNSTIERGQTETDSAQLF